MSGDDQLTELSTDFAKSASGGHQLRGERSNLFLGHNLSSKKQISAQVERSTLLGQGLLPRKQIDGDDLLNVAVRPAILAHDLDEEVSITVGGGSIDADVGVVPLASVRCEDGESD
jgi:hypothetical protein